MATIHIKKSKVNTVKLQGSSMNSPPKGDERPFPGLLLMAVDGKPTVVACTSFKTFFNILISYAYFFLFFFLSLKRFL